MPDLICSPIPELSRDEIEVVITRNIADELLIAVLSAALHADDRQFAQHLCIKLAHHPHFNVRGNALLGFAHMAQIDGRLDKRRVKPLIINGLNDQSEYVRGHAEDAKDDTEHYLGW